MSTPGKFTGSAPGRIDFLGGVADYSGSLVLEMPVSAVTRVVVTARTTPEFSFQSPEEGDVILPGEALLKLLRGRAAPEAIRQWLAEVEAPHWTHYMVGCMAVLNQARGWTPRTGLDFQVTSGVPQSMGVSSSAALEVATLRALASLARLTFKGTELARLGQLAENRIVGAPCGLMDQLSSAYGKPGMLLPIVCRPDQLLPLVRLPRGVAVVGWPSGVKHAVSASPYATARCAAFMGKKVIESTFGLKAAHLSEFRPSWFAQNAETILSEAMQGRDFMLQYGATADALTQVHPEKSYPVRAATRFPIQENYRAGLAVKLLSNLRPSHRTALLEHLGELMLQSHAGYSAMGLGCPETDEMVAAAMREGAAKGIYGARVSGGGSGGTVVVLLEEKALPLLLKLSRKICFHDAGPLPLIR
ncbi:MAG: hypothetical protein SFY92_10175 [Verrucomicrobiae bacterium]|nr:hypothetical protein [Verrucomicrobiae bacterium]